MGESVPCYAMAMGQIIKSTFYAPQRIVIPGKFSGAMSKHVKVCEMLGGLMAQADWLDPKVGGHLALFLYSSHDYMIKVISNEACIYGQCVYPMQSNRPTSLY